MAIYFIEKFKNLRKSRNLTQEQIADIFHVSPQAVSRWETGITYPDIELLPALADFFSVTVDDLFGIDINKKEERVYSPPEKTEESNLFSEKPIISKWVADMYDQKVTDTDDVGFLLSVVGEKPKKILEIACGSGRVLMPLAKAGHDVTGLDADEYVLAKIPAKAEGLKNIEWRAADAVQDDWGAGYDVVVLAGNILYNIVSDMDYAKAQELFIRKAASALAKGGYVYIDYSPGGDRLLDTKKESQKHSGEWVVWEGTDSEGNYGKMVLLAGEYDADTRLDRFTRRFEFTLADGETITQDIPCAKHFAPLQQLHGWLADAGFTVEQEYGGYDRSPIGEDSTRVVIYARKADESNIPKDSFYKSQGKNRPKLEDVLNDYLEGDILQNALNFVSWLRANKMAPQYISICASEIRKCERGKKKNRGGESS